MKRIEKLEPTETDRALADRLVGNLIAEQGSIVITARGSLRDVLASGTYDQGFSLLTGKAGWAATCTDLDSADQRVVAVPDEGKKQAPKLEETKKALAELLCAGATIEVSRIPSVRSATEYRPAPGF